MSTESGPAESGVPELPVEDGGSSAPRSLIDRMTGMVAIFGGLLAVAVAVLATVSVLSRWLFNAPIDGDFEYVKMATAVAVFAYLPYAQARRANIMVDTFTGRLSEGRRNALDAFWDLAYALFMGYAAYCLVYGTLAAVRSGETTMQRQILLWPSIAVSTALCLLLAVTAVATALRLLKSTKATPNPAGSTQ
jgi:TRAP-type C4-dicarboxylate transport system permease small subunit